MCFGVRECVSVCVSVYLVPLKLSKALTRLIRNFRYQSYQLNCEAYGKILIYCRSANLIFQVHITFSKFIYLYFEVPLVIVVYYTLFGLTVSVQYHHPQDQDPCLSSNYIAMMLLQFVHEVYGKQSQVKAKSAVHKMHFLTGWKTYSEHRYNIIIQHTFNYCLTNRRIHD